MATLRWKVKKGWALSSFFTLELELIGSTKEYAHDLSGIEVLLVDDNITNLKILGDYLAKFGVKSHVYSDPEMALEFLDNYYDNGDCLDAALIDMQMPGIDGLEFSKAG